VIAKNLDAGLPRQITALQRLVEVSRLHPNRVSEVVSQWAAIREAGRQWAEAAADDNAAAAPTTIPARSEEIDTDRAAGLLGLTPNRVRQLVRSGDLPGRKAGGVWLVDRAAVDIRRSVNSGSFR
jgi:hypothetical protein